MGYTTQDPMPVAVQGGITVTPDLASAREDTQLQVLTELQTPVTYLPLTPLSVGDLTGVRLNFSSTAEQSIVAGTAGQIIRVYRARIFVAGTTNISIKSGTTAQSGAVLEVIPFTAAGGLILDFDSRPYWASSVDNSFVLVSSNAVQVDGRLSYTKG